MFCQFGALNSSLDQSSRSIHESFIEQELSDVKQKSTSGGLSSREQDQARAIQLQKDAFNAQVEGRTSDQGSKAILNSGWKISVLLEFHEFIPAGLNYWK